MDQAVIGVIVLAIVAICQVLKTLTFISARYIPLIAIALGVGAAFGLGGVDWITTAAGIILGLSSSGLYSGVKTVVFNR